jgi:glycine cleavage system H lipoate-binding protein
VISPIDFLEIKGFKVPQGYYLHRGHTWVKVEEGSSVRVGIDEFALRVLGPFDSIEAPLLGKEVNQESADIGVFRKAHQAKILSPVSGVVTAINPRIREQGRLANQDPYSEGWVMNVHSNNLRKDMKNLMINSQSRDFMDGQIERLYQVVEEIEGPLSTDGGHLGDDIYGKMPELGWAKLTRIFLNT